MVCEKCGSKYVLITKTTDNEIASVLCASCGHVETRI